ncbi:MAG: sigma-70 family RNA polymerase sigma factor [Lachnospiraceae bacterium]|nr:sigma-70 family RNA polymerase sigma factor [Lachnospiraceae bacterium]
MQCSENFFCEFYYDTYDAFYRYVKRITRRESVAEDIAQESYCTAYICRDMLMKHPNPAGWLYKTAVYIAGNMRRRKENQALALEAVQETEAVMRVADAYEAVEVEIMMQNVLSQKEWELLHKYYIEGYSGADIAGQLGITEENVRMRLSRTRKKLREKLCV